MIREPCGRRHISTQYAPAEEDLENNEEELLNSEPPPFKRFYSEPPPLKRNISATSDGPPQSPPILERHISQASADYSTLLSSGGFGPDIITHNDDEEERGLGPDSPYIESDAYVPRTMVDDVRFKNPVAERGRLFAARRTRRLVFKDGSCNITSRNVTEKSRKYLVDIFTTVVDMKWRYNLIMFMAAFVISWIAFAAVWYVIALIHKDTEHADDGDWKPCVANVYDFRTALLFSIETQHTIGYGYRVMEPNCPEAYTLLMFQSCLGVFIQSMMTGIIFAKLSLPKRRAHTIMFGRRAVISKRDREYCLLFRVGDMRKSHFVGTSIRALLVKDRTTEEGETIPLCQYPLDIQTETCSSDNFVFLVWPVTAVHKINSSSPLWDVSASSLLAEQFEIIVILEGIVESTGMTTQIRTSYLPGEILWGHRPASLLAYQKENGHYRIDYSQFHAVVPISMPEYSAKTLAEKLRRPSFIDPSIHNNKLLDLVRSSRIGRPSMLKRMRSSLRSRKSRQRSGSIQEPEVEKKDDVIAGRFSNGRDKKGVYLNL